MITLTAYITKTDGSPIEVNYRNSLSIERKILDRSNLKLPSWGIISNGGRLRFVDGDGAIKQLADGRLLVSNMEVNLLLEDTLSGAKSSVGKFVTNQWNYNNNNKEVTVSLKDELEEWQDILIEPIYYNPHSKKNIDFADVYNYLYDLTPTKYNMLTLEQLDNATVAALHQTFVEFWIFTPKNLWSAWTYLCNATQCHIFRNNQGNTVCRHSEG